MFGLPAKAGSHVTGVASAFRRKCSYQLLRIRRLVGAAQRSGPRAGAVRRGEDVAVGGPHRHAERVPDFGRAECFVVPDQPRQNGKAGCIGRRPSLGTSVVGVQIEERTRQSSTRLPRVDGGMEMRLVCCGFRLQPEECNVRAMRKRADPVRWSQDTAHSVAGVYAGAEAPALQIFRGYVARGL